MPTPTKESKPTKPARKRASRYGACSACDNADAYLLQLSPPLCGKCWHAVRKKAMRKEAAPEPEKAPPSPAKAPKPPEPTPEPPVPPEEPEWLASASDEVRDMIAIDALLEKHNDEAVARMIRWALDRRGWVLSIVRKSL